MQDVWFIEHRDGGQWWHVLTGWVPRQDFAARFTVMQEAEVYLADNSHLKGCKLVKVRVDDNRAPGSAAVVDYDPFNLAGARNNG